MRNDRPKGPGQGPGRPDRRERPPARPAKAQEAGKRGPAHAPERASDRAIEPPPAARRESVEEIARENRRDRPPVDWPPGDRPAFSAPVILEVEPGTDYALMDSGDGEKLERYGPLTIRRPENQAIWPRRLPSARWDGADAIFTGDTDEEGAGRWRFPAEPLGETWPMREDGLSYLGRFTSFRHVGVFPEQTVHWRFMVETIERDRTRSNRPVRVLNLFGYTGLASLLAARAGAEVTHVDASKRAIAWARENAELAGLSDKPIRWICEDAVRYAEREARRGSTYDIILLDPPKFGRGPKGEVWQLFEDLPHLLVLMRRLLSDRPLALVLTAYSIRSSFYSLSALMGEAMRGLGGTVESGELVIREAGEDARHLSTSLFSRWVSA